MMSRCSRRQLLSRSVTLACTSPLIVNVADVLAMTDAAGQTAPSLADRMKGLLLGSAIGDAAGGPVEFRDSGTLAQWLPNTRAWTDGQPLDEAAIAKLATTLQLLPYRALRPQPAPYAHWTENAEPGTVTDDTRMKFLTLAAIRRALVEQESSITERDLAREFIEFSERPLVRQTPGWPALCGEGLREFNMAARWVLGERDLSKALPPERLWGGVGTVSGQMTLLPLACLHAGDPESAYRTAHQIAFFDNGDARDINAAIVAGLATALVAETKPSMKSAWQAVWQTMRRTDPFRYADVPWVPRPTTRWLDFAMSAARRAEKQPKRLFDILENEGHPKFWWEAHFIMASAVSMLQLCQYNGRAAVHLALDFGHDTDSTAQLIGAFYGAVEGARSFSPELSGPVMRRLKADYAEDVDEWVSTLVKMRAAGSKRESEVRRER